MTCWGALDDELARWRDDGRTPGFWWRDDDAVRATDALDRLLALGRRWRAPISLAVIPGLADGSLAEILNGETGVTILQHGFRHINHAMDGDKKSELGSHRPIAAVISDLDEGRAVMQSLFGSGTLPVLAPPWNRIDNAVVTQLPGLGFCGISRFRARDKQEATPGLAQVNTHVDIIDWAGDRGFRGVEAVLGELCDHLAARRAGAVDSTEPTGLLTHHLDHDEDCWAFIATLLDRTCAGATNMWQSADEIFQPRAGLQ